MTDGDGLVAEVVKVEGDGAGRGSNVYEDEGGVVQIILNGTMEDDNRTMGAGMVEERGC